jgi:hypothetical protein
MSDPVVCRAGPDSLPIALIATWLLAELGGFPGLTVSIRQPDTIVIEDAGAAREQLVACIETVLIEPRFDGVRITSG